MDTAIHTTDPIAMVRSLDATALRARLRELDREADALRVLLRAVEARDRRPRVAEEAAHA